MINDPIGDVLRLGPAIPVVTIDDAASAVPLARALLAGGIKVIEVTLRTPAGLRAIEAIAAKVPAMTVAAGTVLDVAQMRAVQSAGARIAFAPGITRRLLEAAAATGLPVLPGVADASQIMLGLEAGLGCFKLFPASLIGGTALVQALAGPFPDVRFCPTGGITADNAAAWLALPQVLCVGASWIAPREAIAAGNWELIEGRARAAAALA